MGHNVNCLSGASLKNSFNSRWNPAFGGWRWWDLSKYVTIIFFLLNQHLESMDFLFDPSKVFFPTPSFIPAQMRGPADFWITGFASSSEPQEGRHEFGRSNVI